MPTATLKADQNNDLDVIDGRNLAVIEGAAACLQNIKQKTLMRTGEDIYDVRNGVDYFGTVFSQNRDTDGARQSITEAIMSCPDTLSVEQLNIDVRGDTFNFEAQVMTTYGALDMRNISNAVKPRAGRPIGAANLPSASERVMSMVSSAMGAKFMYDPSDSTTLFQDAAGTTPVTALEQPVGLILDKSGAGLNASQANAARRPTVTARYNEFTESEFRNGLVDAPVRGNIEAATLPGYLGALQFAQDAPAAASYAYKTTYAVVGQQFMFSAVVRMSDGGPPVFSGSSGSPTNDFAIYVSPSSASPTLYVTTPLGNGLYRVAVIGTVDVTGVRSFGIVKYAGNNKTRSFIATAYQLTFGDLITHANFRYQRVNTLTDYDAKGWPVALRFAGSQGFVTPALQLGSQTQMSITGGLTYPDEPDLSTWKMFMEIGGGYTGAVGRFELSLGETQVGAITYARRSSVPPANSYRRTGQPLNMGPTAQRRTVFTVNSDCTKTDILIRYNGVNSTAPVANGATSPTFATGYLSIGQRGDGTPTLGMVGLWYGALLISRLQTDTEIATTEQFYRQKMAPT